MPNTVDGKTVYVLGAGASMHSGAPLLRDFMNAAASLHNRREELKFKDSFDAVFSWVDEFKRNYARSPIGYENLESVFSLLHTACETEDPIAIKLKLDLVNVMFETLDKSILLQNTRDSNFGDPIYNEFVNKVHRLNLSRKNRIREGSHSNDVLITFNYDILIDLAFKELGFSPNYGLPGSAAGGDWIPLYKLHGSMNWAEHIGCKQEPRERRGIQVLEAGSAIKWFENSPSPHKKRLPVYRDLKQIKCQNDGCNYYGVLTPVFVPPTWSKSPSIAGLSGVWNQAVSSLRDAEQIVVMGYSMPPTDTFFQYLIALGMRTNLKLRRVIIVNIDESKELIDRYKSIFSSEIRFVNYAMDFKSYVMNSGFGAQVGEY